MALPRRSRDTLHSPLPRTCRAPRRHTLRVTVAAVGALLVTGCVSDGDSQSVATAEPDPVAGEQTYQDFCGACHGRDFEGSVQGPSHLDAHFAPEVTTDEDYRAAIRNGVEEQNYDFGDMPAISGLDDQEIADVTAYIRQVQEERGLSG